MFVVAPLYQRPDLIEQAAGLMQTTWPIYYGLDGPGDALSDLEKRSRSDGLPFGLVALSDDRTLAGLGALSGPSYGSQPGEDLWLIGLCVHPDQRKNGAGTAIVQALMDHAHADGHPHLYATTNTAAGLLSRLGWQTLRKFDDGHGRWEVMCAHLWV